LGLGWGLGWNWSEDVVWEAFATRNARLALQALGHSCSPPPPITLKIGRKLDSMGIYY
jgi:hypothetical protein